MNFIAHRGYSAKYPENTLAAFDAALRHPECGKRLVGIELDIRLTRDNRVAVFHDPNVMIGGVRVPIEKLALSELRHNVKERLRGETAPVLDDVLDLVQHRLDLWIEIKNAAYDKSVLMDSLESSLRRYAAKGNIVLHSFSPEIMRLAVERFKRSTGIRYGALVSDAEQLDGFGPELLAQMDLIHPQWEYLIESEQTFLAMGKPLMVWTIDRPADLAAFAAGTSRIARAGVPITIATNDMLLLQA
jgi:glycerophosphoryl diester phosphodiesterase